MRPIRSGPVGKPGHQEIVATTRNALKKQGSADSQDGDVGALFGASAGAYTSHFTLPGDHLDNGPQRRDVGMRLADRGEDYGGKTRAREWVLALLPGDQVTAEDVRRGIGDNVIRPAAWGSIMSTLARQGYLHRVGYVQAERATSNARVIALWERV